MPDPFFFGHAPRLMFGLRHPAAPMPAGAVLVCAPLLQEGIRCQRALWTLGQAMASKGLDAMRFDWYGSGDSLGASAEMTLAGMAADLRAACATMAEAGTTAPARLLALRSAALPVLAHAANSATPVDVVLWAPVLEGAALVSSWREQHRRQLCATGRFLRPASAADDELLGFVLDMAFVDALQSWQGSRTTLPAGSRLLLAQWRSTGPSEEFVHRQTAAGVAVECLQLEPGDEPDWDNPDHFETQIFPRRAVSRIAAHLARTA